jgi:hypothetical protein
MNNLRLLLMKLTDLLRIIEKLQQPPVTAKEEVKVDIKPEPKVG